MDPGLDRQVPTPELNNNYVNSSVMLSKGNDYSIGKAIKRKRNSDGNAIGRINNNLILDTREYPVDFDDGKISELKANVIAESMYATCDDSGNEYLLMYLIVEYWKNDTDIKVPDHNLVHRGWIFMR